jgi:hypothetical protein
VNIVLWIIAGLLAFVFLIAGAYKVIRPKDKLAAMGMTWTEDFSAGMVKLIGALELAAAAGLILPAVFDIAPILVPLAAVGLALLMIGAGITHIRRGEGPVAIFNVATAAVALVVAWGRFGPYSFG